MIYPPVFESPGLLNHTVNTWKGENGGNIVHKLKFLAKKAQGVAESIEKFVTRDDPKYFLLMKPTLDPALYGLTPDWTRLGPERRTHPDPARQTRFRDAMQETQSDRCMADLMGTWEDQPSREDQPSCHISPPCAGLMLGRASQSGYSLTHQLLFVFIGARMGCLEQLDSKSWKLHGLPISRLTEAFLRRVLREAQDIADSGFARNRRDLFLEQEVVGLLFGFEDFIKTEWLDTILSWQTQSGCYSPFSRRTDSRSLTSRIQLRRDSYSLDGECSAHMTTLAVGTLALYATYMAQGVDVAQGVDAAQGRKEEKNQENQDSAPDANGEPAGEPDFSDPEGYVDNISEEELLGELLDKKPKESGGIDSIIVVDGIPKVGPERLEKLQSVIRKIFSSFGKLVTEHYPTSEDGFTKGYMFLEYSSPVNAANAVKTTNGYKLDKAHTFCVNVFTDFEKYASIPEDWIPPEPQPFKDHGDLRSWLTNPDCYDQYSVIYEGGEKTAIYLNSFPEPSLIEQRARWTETYVRWSPLGTYLATFHQRGVALWGGEGFQQIMKFSHPGVQFIDFSPQEKYLVTFSPHAATKQMLGDPGEPQAVIIWDVLTGQRKRSFHAGIWPILRWSHDDQYFARCSQDMLSVYETPSFGLLDKKSLKLPGIKDFSWSPTDNIIAYWMAEEKDIPARVTLLEIPSRNEIRVKNLFNVADCKMHWQKSGDYLCVKVDRYSKVKKDKDEIKYSGMYYNFEVFHMREKQIPVDSVEIKEQIQAFAWEPVGNKFAVVHGEAPSINVSFYSVKTGQTPILLKKFERKQCNQLFWSPAGQFIVLAGLRGMKGDLEFVDTSDFSILNSSDHYMATDVEWDPTGRYVATALGWWTTKVDNAYWLWTFQGKILQKHTPEKFCQLLWRPRPPSLLDTKQIKEVKKNLKKYSKKFDHEDSIKSSVESKVLLDKRRKLLKEFKDYRERKEEEFIEQRLQRLQLRDNVDTDTVQAEETNMDVETLEFLMSEDVTVLKD
ncbi:unnamed protein product [Darwinula stevensoni]|uniref:Eukaryotic translation initiation factor 3 subunit B n=1 Tax=Darwinula stevensoni TaxID=69355 RepID=A0A7R9ACB0_9CRUS|nr:unnamed protein product [Darwinula stevensoni]CAG0900020.1 unnamed protein product [Darwinula stevensoni]